MSNNTAKPQCSSRRNSQPVGYRTVYTTGEIARILGCSPRTASHLIDTGRLKGYRLKISARNPGDRRVPYASLAAYLAREGMLDSLAFISPLAVVLTDDDRIAEALAPAFTRVRSGFDLAVETHGRTGGVVVLDLSHGRGECLNMIRIMRYGSYRQTRFVAVANEDESDRLGLKAAGFADVFVRPFDSALLAERVSK